MKLSEVGVQDLIVYARIDAPEEEIDILNAILSAGRQFILSQTGLSAAEADEKEDLSLAMLMVCTSIYENRSYEAETGKVHTVNLAAKAIIDQYCKNIL